MTSNIYAETFDIVSMFDVIEHVFDHDTFIKYCINALAENGRLLIETCPLYYSPVGHHLFAEFVKEEEPWAHLKNDFRNKIIEKNVGQCSVDRFNELNKCTYSDIKKSISQFNGAYVKDYCPIINEFEKLYYATKNELEIPSGIFIEDLFRDVVEISCEKTK